MRRIPSAFLLLPAFALSASLAHAETPTAADAKAIPVSADNFPRAESDFYFSRLAKDNAFGVLRHRREVARVTHQTVIRLNRDTLYSSDVFDLDAGPMTITMPDAGNPTPPKPAMPTVSPDLINCTASRADTILLVSPD